MSSSELSALAQPFFAAGDHIGVRLPGAGALFSTRRGGISKGPFATLNLGRAGAQGELGDDPGAVAENRRRLASRVGWAWGEFGRIRQVHGTHVRVLDRPPEPPESDAPGGAHEALVPGDGLATERRGRPLVVLVADCLPVALAAPGAVAMLHVGWRGLAGGIVEGGVATLRNLGSGANITAVIGPGVGGCCYEVGPEVRRALGAGGPETSGPGRVDLKRVAAQRLSAAGAAEVHDVGLCTMCSDPGLFFSHRRDHGVTGRQAGVVWRS